MTRTYQLVVVAVLAAAVVFACSRGYESQKTVNDLTISISAGRYPLIKGDNALGVKVTDAAGKPVTDAKVDVRYYMPPMPGMAPMDYTTQAVLKGSAYSFTANPSMEGGWRVEVTVTRPGKPAATATFNLDAR